MSKSFALFLAGAMAVALRAASLEATLVGHVITYTDEAGHRQRIDVGKPCDDLWVAPDESAFAFIGIDSYADFPGPPEGQIPFTTTVYIARRADHFAPKRILDTVRSEPHTLRDPSISSNGRYVFFLFAPPQAGFLYGYNLRTGKTENLDHKDTRNLMDYCTVRSGPYAGGVYVMERYFTGQLDPYFGERCYLKALREPEVPASCSQFEYGGALKRGAACRQVPR